MLVSGVMADNPIIPDQGVCDPHIRIFNDKAYLFSSHDYAPGQPIYRMDDWQLFSSSNLVDWTKEFVLRPQDTYIGAWTSCYATDGATRNGKYYFYFSKGQESTGVAVSTNGPAGPYTDALGAPLLPALLANTASYDPAVFIDDDTNQTPYIIWGYTVSGKSYYMSKLNNDMVTRAEAPQIITIENTWLNDAPFMHKRNGLYYLNSHGSDYATSTNVYGPFTNHRKFCYDATVDHGGFFVWNNQTFFAYGVPDTDLFYRKTKIVYIHYRDNGDIADDTFIEQSTLGVGQYDATWSKIEAEWYFAASRDGKAEGGSRFEIRNITNDMYLNFPNFKNLETNTSFRFMASSANPDGATIEIRQDGPAGPLLGVCTVPNTGSWTTYQTVSAVLTNGAGTLNIYFVFKGSGTELMRLDWFNTSSALPVIVYEAEDAILSGGCAANSNHTGYSGTGFVDGYAGNSNATTTFTIPPLGSGRRNINLSVGYSCGAGGQTVAIGVNGSTIKSASLSATANWDTWGLYSTTLVLPPGTNTIFLKAPSNAIVMNLDYIEIQAGSSFTSPYLGSNSPIPGIIQAENFDKGGEGVGYHDTEITNYGGQYRPAEAVDIESCGDTGGGYSVGWFYQGEWMDYGVSVTQGIYAIDLRVASPQATSVTLSLDGAPFAVVAVPNTGGWTTWQTVTVSNIVLPNAVSQLLRVAAPAGSSGPNLNWIQFTRVSSYAVTTNHSVPHAWLDTVSTNVITDYEAVALADPDGDGFTTWQEYWSGTDPVNSNSFLRIDSVTLEGANAVLKWQHARVDAGLPPITILSLSNLVSGAWGDVGSKTPTNGLNTWSWSIGSSAQGFYRLSVTNAP
jgi:hypothetical protein